MPEVTQQVIARARVGIHSGLLNTSIIMKIMPHNHENASSVDTNKDMYKVLRCT